MAASLTLEDYKMDNKISLPVWGFIASLVAAYLIGACCGAIGLGFV